MCSYIVLGYCYSDRFFSECSIFGGGSNIRDVRISQLETCPARAVWFRDFFVMSKTSLLELRYRCSDFAHVGSTSHPNAADCHPPIRYIYGTSSPTINRSGMEC